MKGTTKIRFEALSAKKMDSRPATFDENSQYHARFRKITIALPEEVFQSRFDVPERLQNNRFFYQARIRVDQEVEMLNVGHFLILRTRLTPGACIMGQQDFLIQPGAVLSVEQPESALRIGQADLGQEIGAVIFQRLAGDHIQ